MKTFEYDTELDIVYQIVCFADWDDDEEADRLQNKAIAAGYPEEAVYCFLAGSEFELVDRDMFDHMAPKIVYLFENTGDYAFETLRFINQLGLKEEEYRWI
jgi:hypothetical protein